MIGVGKRALATIASALVAGIGCGPKVQADPDPGVETGPCIAGSCRDGSTCLSDLCVDATGTGGGDDDDGDVGPDGGSIDDADGGSDDAPVPNPAGPFDTVSLLFVLDNSGSMAEEQATLAAGIAALVQPLENAGLDYRIGVTTTDNGNPWCPGTGPEGGKLVASSCRSRTQDFVFMGFQTIDATQEACLDVCPAEWDSIAINNGRPWVENVGGVTNLPGGLSVVQALQCLLPQGINGCGFEEQLESTYKAIARSTIHDEAQYGFVAEDARLVVILVTDEIDTSYNKDWEGIFLPDGDPDHPGSARVFWANPDEGSPTSALGWNAGVQCVGTSPYDDCQPANKDILGNAVSDAEADQRAVLRPVSRYIDRLTEHSAMFFVIGGVNSDGSVTYADALSDPQFQKDFGIGPGCQSAAGRAAPPVRIRAVAEAVGAGPQQRMFSICNDDYGSTLAAIAQTIVAASGG